MGLGSDGWGREQLERKPGTPPGSDHVELLDPCEELGFYFERNEGSLLSLEQRGDVEDMFFKGSHWLLCWEWTVEIEMTGNQDMKRPVRTQVHNSRKDPRSWAAGWGSRDGAMFSRWSVLLGFPAEFPGGLDMREGDVCGWLDRSPEQLEDWNHHPPKALVITKINVL